MLREWCGLASWCELIHKNMPYFLDSEKKELQRVRLVGANKNHFLSVI